MLKLDDLKILKSAEAIELLTSYADTPPENFSLRMSGKTKLPVHALATLLKCRQNAKHKLSGLPVEEMLFDTVPLEQSSSTLTAEYKFSNQHGIRAVDITGGLGIDTLFLSDKFRDVYHFEQSEVLSEMARYNASLAERTNINFIQGDSMALLKNFPDKHFDLLYADPARRDESRRSVDIRYLKPDILANYEFLKSKTKKILIKLSPAFDISEAIELFPEISNITVVSVNDECKELLLEIIPGNKSGCNITGVELRANKEPVLVTNRGGDILREIERQQSVMNGYLYESYCGISKAGLDFISAEKFGLKSIYDSEFYFHSEICYDKFPGKIYKVIAGFPYNLKSVKKLLSERGITQINIKAKGIPIKPAEVTSGLKIKNGGDYFLFVIASDKNYKVLLAQKHEPAIL